MAHLTNLTPGLFTPPFLLDKASCVAGPSKQRPQRVFRPPWSAAWVLLAAREAAIAIISRTMTPPKAGRKREANGVLRC